VGLIESADERARKRIESMTRIGVASGEAVIQAKKENKWEKRISKKLGGGGKEEFMIRQERMLEDILNTC